MAAPAGALQHAVLVAVPLALVVLIFVTPGLIGKPQSPAIPVLSVGVAKQPWNSTYNETAVLYVRDALGNPLYDDLSINVTGLGNYSGTLWSTSGFRVPFVLLKFPVNATRVANVTAVAFEGRAEYRYNVTVEFRFDQGWVFRVTPEGETSYRDWPGAYSVTMRREGR